MRKGFKHTPETKEKMRLSKLGVRPSEETLIKLSESHKGQTAWNKGIKRWWNSPSQFVKGQNSGDKHPNWKGGVSKKYKTGYYSEEYINWRKSVFQRDNFTCQECGSAGYITAHHIKSFAKFPELRFDLNNGITLCECCHSKTDNYKGRANKVIVY